MLTCFFFPLRWSDEGSCAETGSATEEEDNTQENTTSSQDVEEERNKQRNTVETLGPATQDTSDPTVPVVTKYLGGSFVSFPYALSSLVSF